VRVKEFIRLASFIASSVTAFSDDSEMGFWWLFDGAQTWLTVVVRWADTRNIIFYGSYDEKRSSCGVAGGV
jgi:hypothetical protein